MNMMLQQMKSSITSCLKGLISLSVVVLLTVSLSSCQKDDQYEKREKAVLTVRVFDGLNSFGNQVSCYVMSNDNSSKWSIVPLEEEDGWGLEEGFEYSVLTWKLWYKEPMMDGSSFVYRFRKVLKKTTSEPLTTDDILWEIW